MTFVPDPTAAGSSAGGGTTLVGRSLSRALITRALADSGGALVCGPTGVGVSALLADAARQGRDGNRTIRYAVAGASRSAAVLGLDDGTLDAPGVRPIVLVLDDAHLLDSDEAARVMQRVLDGRVRCVLGSTAPEELPEPLDWLWRSGQLARIDVEPLKGDDVAIWVTSLLDAPPDAPTLDALMADCAGLPGLLVDTLAALVAAPVSPIGPATEDAGRLALRSGYVRLSGRLPCPPALRQRVTTRLAGLDADTLRALDRICVTRRLDEDSAATTVSLASLRELQRRQLVIAPLHRARPGLAPRAGAIRRAVLAELGPIGVSRVAARLLEDAPGAPTLDRELWVALSATTSGGAPTEATIRQLIADKRLDEAEMLARSAAERGDPAAAVTVAQFLAERGDRAGAARYLDELLGGGGLETRVMVQATAELVQILLWDLDQTERAVTLAESAVTATGGVDGPAGPILLAVLTHAGRIRPATKLFDVLDRAGRSLDGLVSGAGATALALSGRLDEAIALAEKGLARAIGSDPTDPAVDPESQILALSVALTESGRVEDADAFTATWYGLARRHPPELAWMALARSRVALALGDLSRAEAHGREAEGIFAQIDLAVPLRWSIATQLLAAGLRGDAEACVAHGARLDRVPPTGAAFLETDVKRARAWARHAAGDTIGARQVLIGAAEAAERDGNLVLAMNAWHDALRLGDRQQAPIAIERLASAVSGSWGLAAAAHVAALTADDPAALLDAGRDLAAAGRRLEAAEAAAEALDRARRKDRRALVRLAGTALAAWQTVCPDAMTPPLQTIRQAELTDREREVSALAARGTASRLIAEELGISVRTVDNFLSRAYTKLGVRSRAELAAALTRPSRPAAGHGRSAANGA
jgi:DNA-binding NarL/FixJ family response regulator